MVKLKYKTYRYKTYRNIILRLEREFCSSAVHMDEYFLKKIDALE